MLERKILVSSDVDDLCDVNETVQSTLTNHQKVIVFSSTLIVKTLSNSDELSSRKSDIVTKESLIRLWLETSWVRHWCSCVLGICDVTEVESSFLFVSQMAVREFQTIGHAQQTLSHFKIVFLLLFYIKSGLAIPF